MTWDWLYVVTSYSQNQCWFDITVYSKKYAHGYCFAVLCCGYTLTDFPISNRLTSLALWQSNDCPSASKATLVNMDKYFMWIHYERLHNHNKAKHNKTVCIFLGIYCSWPLRTNGLISCMFYLFHSASLLYSSLYRINSLHNWICRIQFAYNQACVYTGDIFSSHGQKCFAFPMDQTAEIKRSHHVRNVSSRLRQIERLIKVNHHRPLHPTPPLPPTPPHPLHHPPTPSTPPPPPPPPLHPPPTTPPPHHPKNKYKKCGKISKNYFKWNVMGLG